MKRKGAILAMAVVALLLGVGILSRGRAPLEPRVTIAFLGFTNALPHPEAPEETPSREAVFQVTNHTALTLVYTGVIRAGRMGGLSSAMTEGTRDLPGHGTSNFGISVEAGATPWNFDVVAHVSRPRPAWQLRTKELAKWLGLPPIFVGTTRVYPCWTNFSASPQ